ncbi:helix-turn-helix domain-containing protein [Rathayibacter oskolensis]|uniref:helix-turn-helix domain-containing protein n=1 Tax=Rathayibacter oskolensis TaxID=1891671 RepID=UPI00265EC85D|nr:helix-turn-helix domain-containing protein [Rathayibacter oskolensis]WKK70620.1 helix-turn-helix domain-containing protein [Rathayibacter oskolensis]
MEATAAAVESELLIQRLRRPRHPRRPRPAAARAPSLRVLGRGTGLVTADGVVLELSARHAEILTLLAWHRAGLSAEQLALHLHGREEAVVTVRAEMVRLRKILEPSLPRLVPLSRPYRLGTPVDLDARQVLGLLDRGSHRLALDAYAGPPLPGSEAPGIRAIADELRARVRESILTSAAAPTLLAYANGPHGGDDAEVWTELLHLLPLRSPRRAGVVARLEALERD